MALADTVRRVVAMLAERPQVWMCWEQFLGSSYNSLGYQLGGGVLSEVLTFLWALQRAGLVLLHWADQGGDLFVKLHPKQLPFLGELLG